MPDRESTGFYPPGATLAFLLHVSLCLLVLAALWRRAAGPPRRPALTALAMTAVFLLVQEAAVRCYLDRLPRGAYAPHPLLRWDLHGFDRTLTGQGAPAPAKEPGEFRVLCLGDSATYGVGVAFHEAWPRRLHGEFGGRNLRVVNHGVPGWSTWQSMAWFEREGLALQPDLVVLASSFNDWQDADTPDRAWVGTTPAERAVRRAVMDPALAQVLRALLLPGPRQAGYPRQAARGLRVPPEDRRLALERVRTLCAERGIPLVLALMPQAVFPRQSLEYAEDLRRYAREHELPLADAQHAVPPDLFPAGDPIHPLAGGHQTVAPLVAEGIRQAEERAGRPWNSTK